MNSQIQNKFCLTSLGTNGMSGASILQCDQGSPANFAGLTLPSLFAIRSYQQTNNSEQSRQNDNKAQRAEEKARQHATCKRQKPAIYCSQRDLRLLDAGAQETRGIMIQILGYQLNMQKLCERVKRNIHHTVKDSRGANSLVRNMPVVRNIK